MPTPAKNEIKLLKQYANVQNKLYLLANLRSQYCDYSLQYLDYK